MAELQKSFKASSLSSVSLLLLLVLLWLNITARPSMAATDIPVGVILDLNSKLGLMVVNSLYFAVQDYYSVNKKTTTMIRLILRNASQNDFATAAAEDVMEKFASSAAGWMVILTSFLFILVVQVYTANLTSILTQGRQKEPTFKDETEIIRRNLSVGYRNGSWVEGLLIHQIGFHPSQLKALGSREEYNETLSKGTKNGGVDAIFDETPYLTLFLSKYKSGFMMTGPIYKTGGFAFAFPKKSSLSLHFSNAILKVTQDAEPYRVLMARSSLPISIEDFEFGEDESDIETSKLDIDIFGGLYPVLLSVVALFLCLSIPSVIKRLPNPSLVIEWWRKKNPFKLANKA